MEFSDLISTQDVAKHNTPSDCWIVIDDQVWDVTTFAPSHPGGVNRKSLEYSLEVHALFLTLQVILQYAGRDATSEYSDFHSPSLVKDSLSLDCFKGNLDRSTIDENWKREPVADNNTLAAAEDEKPPLHNVINGCVSMPVRAIFANMPPAMISKKSQQGRRRRKRLPFTPPPPRTAGPET